MTPSLQLAHCPKAAVLLLLNGEEAALLLLQSLSVAEHSRVERS